MRWRPDLVSEHDDSCLTLSTRFQRGRYTATVYEINDADGVHCRLDDGNRFVGLNADAYQFISDEGLEPVWQRLERELGNNRHLDPDDDPWADVFGRILSSTPPRSSGAVWRRRCVHCGQRAVPRDTIVPAPTPLIPWTVDAGVPGQPGDVVANIEHGHDCGRCGKRFPGPALLVTRFNRPEADLIEYRMVIGDRKAGLRVLERDLTRQRHPEEWLERHLERMEAELLTAYARAHPSRPDVVEWIEACNQHARREERRYLEMLRPATSATSWDNPDSNPLADIQSWTQRSVSASFQLSPEAIRSMRESFERVGESMRRTFSSLSADCEPEPEHPMLAAIEARRNRNTGPGQRPRAPRQINPRRGR